MKNYRTFIITGEQGEGKTTLLKKVIRHLKERQIPVAGFIAEGEWENDSRKSFSVIDINTGEKKLLCTDEPREGYVPAGRFYFNPDALEFGESILLRAESGCLLVIDEIGKFELEDRIWADTFRKILKSSKYYLLFTVRRKFLDDVIYYFSIDNPLVFSCDQEEDAIMKTIMGNII